MSRRPADRPVARAAAIAALVAAAFAAGAGARTSDRNQPMDIDAASSTCSLGANDSCTLTDATITQGSLRVVAARAIIEQSGGEPSRALMSGGVTLRQTLDDGNQINATANNVDYNLRTEVVVFTGNVEIRQMRGSLNGQRVVYNMRTNQVESGGAGNGRVKMRILPKSAQQQPAPAKASD
jgi:lipopolysaccharide export system protein LptA